MLTSRVHLCCIALLTTVATRTVDAQVIQSRDPKLSDQWVFGMSGFGGIPVGEFRKHENGGGGAELAVGFQPIRRAPLVLRGSGGFLLYGRYNRDTSRDVCDAFGNCVNEVVFYDARYHNMSFFQAGPELMATDGAWRPFAFALAGVTFFNSWAQYGDPNRSNTSRSLLSSHNFSTAYGLGVRKIGKSFGRAGGFELAFRFTRNAKARYLNEESVRPLGNGTYEVSPRTGAANVAGIHLGFWVGPYVHWSER
jgi:hypothetical protein